MVWGVGRVGAKHSRKRGSGSQRRHVPLESGSKGLFQATNVSKVSGCRFCQSDSFGANGIGNGAHRLTALASDEIG
jgi:hypothetical protein